LPIRRSKPAAFEAAPDRQNRGNLAGTRLIGSTVAGREQMVDFA
jgi:hypothetical protein